MKRSTGDILAVHEIRERKNDTVKNYAITIKYNSRSGTHNMYKEYRDTALVGAVEQMYAELAGRHRPASPASTSWTPACCPPASAPPSATTWTRTAPWPPSRSSAR